MLLLYFCFGWWCHSVSYEKLMLLSFVMNWIDVSTISSYKHCFVIFVSFSNNNQLLFVQWISSPQNCGHQIYTQNLFCYFEIVNVCVCMCVCDNINHICSNIAQSIAVIHAKQKKNHAQPQRLLRQIFSCFFAVCYFIGSCFNFTWRSYFLMLCIEYIHRVQEKRGHGFFCITLTNVDTVS